MEFLHREGVTLHYGFRPGQGRAVVLIHALGTDLRLWDDVVARLPATAPVLRVDLRGHGLSSDGAADIDTLADDLAAVMAACGLGCAVLCGISAGGLVAQRLAARRPDAAAARCLAATGLRIATPQLWEDRIALVEREGLRAAADAIAPRWFAPGFPARAPAVFDGLREMLRRTSPEGYVALCRTLRDTDLGDDAPTIAVPALCLAGRADAATPTGTVAALAAALPRAELRVLDGVGHLPCIEAPAAMASALRDLAARA